MVNICRFPFFDESVNFISSSKRRVYGRYFCHSWIYGREKRSKAITKAFESSRAFPREIASGKTGRLRPKPGGDLEDFYFPVRVCASSPLECLHLPEACVCMCAYAPGEKFFSLLK